MTGGLLWLEREVRFYYVFQTLLAPYFLIVQSEELLLLKPVIFTKNSMVHDLDVLSISLLTYLVLYYAVILE